MKEIHQKAANTAGGVDGIGGPFSLCSGGTQTQTLSLFVAHTLLGRTGQYVFPLFIHRSSQQIKFITASNYNYSLQGLHNETVNENDKWERHPNLRPSATMWGKPSN